MSYLQDQSKETNEGKLRLSMQLCFSLYSTMLGVNKVYRNLLRDLDLTYPQYLVMLSLWEKDQVNVSEICNQLFLETTTLTPLLKRLEVRGLINRRRSLDDERQVIVSLTEAGLGLRERAVDLPDCVARAMGCSIEDISSLRETLNEIRASLFRGA